MFDLYPRHSHRTPQQIAEDSGGSFEPRRSAGRSEELDQDAAGRRASASESADVAMSDQPESQAAPR